MDAFVINTLSPAFSGASLIGMCWLVFTVTDLKDRQRLIGKKVDALFIAYNHERGADGLPAIDIRD